MATVVDNMGAVPRLLSAPRAIAMVAVAWSPYHRLSLPVLDALESSHDEWLPDSPVDFFVFWPEKDDQLNRWYEDLCEHQYPHMELHGHGYAPLWWLVQGRIVDCLTKPYEIELAALIARSVKAFQILSHFAERGRCPACHAALWASSAIAMGTKRCPRCEAELNVISFSDGPVFFCSRPGQTPRDLLAELAANQNGVTVEQMRIAIDNSDSLDVVELIMNLENGCGAN